MNSSEVRWHSIIKANRHMSALHLQHLIWNMMLVLVPVGKIQARLEIERAEAHNAGAVLPR